MTEIQATAGLQVIDDILAILEVWDINLGGKQPKITSIWDESLLTYNETDSYILIQIDRELPQIFSHMQTGTSYDWLHDISLTFDIRVYDNNLDKLNIRFKQVLDYFLHLMKNNVRIAGHIELLPSANGIYYDYTIKNLRRATIGFRILDHDPKVTL